MGSIPLIMSFRDARNILTLATFCVIILIVYKIYNDLEVRTRNCKKLYRIKKKYNFNFHFISFIYLLLKGRMGENEKVWDRYFHSKHADIYLSDFH
jgi:hypothetical protein